MPGRNVMGKTRASGLLGVLNPEESLVAKSILAGQSPARALAEARGKSRPGPAEARDVARVMASERVRRTLAGVTGSVGVSDLRRYVLERLVEEAETAREGSTRIKAVELLGSLPGVDAWKPQDQRAESLEEAGFALAGVLDAVAARLSSDVVDVPSVQGEPNPAPAAGAEPDWDDVDPAG